MPGANKNEDNQMNMSIKYARSTTSARPSEHQEPNPSDILTRYSMKNELTLSLPQMGPSFNFYKFRGTHDAYKTKFRETQRDLRQVDDVLCNRWGETMN